MWERKIGVVLNPSKFRDPEAFRSQVRSALRELYEADSSSAADGDGDQGPHVSFYDTSVEDAGRGQARQAVADGCSLVIAAGGDGTVRLVAAGLAGTDASMAIIPSGTGNLFARNLDLPREDVHGALSIAVRGNSMHVDVGWLGCGTSNDEAQDAEPEPFLVIAGLGFDAVIMEATGSRLKKYMGWLAYAVAGLTHVVGRGHIVRLTLDGRRTRPIRARTVMIGNVGRLPGGITIMPGADASNGSLEVLALDWKGAMGFGQIVREMVTPGARLLARISSRRTYQTRRMTLVTARAQPVQVDGDYLGDATHVVAWVQARALKIRTAEDIQV